MSGTRGRLARLSVAVAIVVSASLGIATLSSATPSRSDLRAAEAKLNALNDRLSLLVEQYNQARVRLEAVRSRLAEAKAAMQDARARASRARADLASRASLAYQGMGLQVNLLLGAQTLSDFSDRLQFMESLAQNDTDLANEAQTAEQEAQWAAGEYAKALDEQRQIVAKLAGQKAEIRSAIGDQRALIGRINQAIRRAHRRALAEAAAQITGITGQTSGNPPPANTAAAQAAINAAYSVLGTPYSWGGSSPQTGFDCSGLTMWSWAHGGVSLPHSSAAQYSVLPKVPQDQLQPGDLLFFYSPIHHVGLYVGGGRMIDANHPGDVAAIRSVTWQYYVGAGRPG